MLELNRTSVDCFFKVADSNLSSESDVKGLLKLWDPAFYFINALQFIKCIDVDAMRCIWSVEASNRLLPECFLQLRHGQILVEFGLSSPARSEDAGIGCST